MAWVVGIASLLISVSRAGESEDHVVLAPCESMTGRSSILAECAHLLEEFYECGVGESYGSGDLCEAASWCTECGEILKLVLLED